MRRNEQPPLTRLQLAAEWFRAIDPVQAVFVTAACLWTAASLVVLFYAAIQMLG